MAEFKIIMVDDERSQSPDLRGLHARACLGLVFVRIAAQPPRTFACPPHSGRKRQSSSRQCNCVHSPRQSITNHRQGADAP